MKAKHSTGKNYGKTSTARNTNVIQNLRASPSPRKTSPFMHKKFKPQKVNYVSVTINVLIYKRGSKKTLRKTFSYTSGQSWQGILSLWGCLLG
jgi:hypothetical protein